MAIDFYYAPMSTAVVTELVLAELGVEHNRIDMSIQDRDTRTPDFLKLNPNGQVPVLVHDGTPLWESAAITMYLGEVFGVKAGLYPPLGSERGVAMKWIVWGNVALAAAGGQLAATLPLGTDGAVEPAIMEGLAAETRGAEAGARAREDVATCLRVLDDALAGRSFMLAEYTLVDTHLYTFVGWLGMMDVAIAAYPNVTRWVDRCSQRPVLSQAGG